MDKPNLPSPAAQRQAGGVDSRTRVPLNSVRAKLAVPAIEGYHTHWFLDTGTRIHDALRAGYEFVGKGEVAVPNHSLAADRETGDGTDLGSRVTIVSGGEGEGGQAGRLVLMKLRQEWRDADMKAREQVSDRLVDALRAGSIADQGKGGSPEHRYAGQQNRSIFTKRS